MNEKDDVDYFNKVLAENSGRYLLPDKMLMSWTIFMMSSLLVDKLSYHDNPVQKAQSIFDMWKKTVRTNIAPSMKEFTERSQSPVGKSLQGAIGDVEDVRMRYKQAFDYVEFSFQGVIKNLQDIEDSRNEGGVQ